MKTGNHSPSVSSWIASSLTVAFLFYGVMSASAQVSITTQSSNQFVNILQPATFNVVASNATTYQWQKNGTNLANSAKYAGVTTSSMTVTGVTAQDACLTNANSGFRCVITGTGSPSAATSTVASLTVRLMRFAFDDATGSTTTPSDPDSGTNVTLQMVNGANTATDYHGQPNSGVNGIGRALDFSSNATQTPATGPLASLAGSTSLGFNTLSSFTVTCWFRLDSDGLAMNGSGVNPRLWLLAPNGTTDAGSGAMTLKWGDATTDAYNIYPNINNSGPNSGNDTAVNYIGGGSTTTQSNTWYFLALTYDGANPMITYIGRTNVASSAASTQNIGAVTCAITGTGSVFIGNRGDRTRSFDGWIDDVRFFAGTGDTNFVENARLLGATNGPPAAAAPGNNSVTVTWPAFAPAGQTGPVSYNVKRGTVTGGPYTLVGTNVSTTSFMDSAVTNGGTYYYVVAPVNSAGEGNLGAQVSATPAGTTLTVETKADGTGSAIGANNITSGTSTTAYAIVRNGGTFVANTNVTWSLVSITGGVVGGDLVSAGDSKSATFTGHVVGSAVIQAVTNGLTGLSGVQTVVAGAAAQTRVETKADGTGVVLPALNLAAGSSTNAFAIARDSNTNFLGNVAATWSLVSKTGGVVDGDLMAAGNTATFTGHLFGSAVVQAVANGFTGNSGVLTVNTAGPVTQLIWTTQPGNATNGVQFGTQPVLKTADQYGNPSTTGLTATQNVVVTLTAGTGPLVGTTNYNIGVSGNNGVVTFTNLEINSAGVTNQLTAAAASYGSPVSGMAVWLDANNAATVLTNASGSVTNWLDSSGNGNSFSNLVGTGTGIVYTNATTPAGRRTVTFPGAGLLRNVTYRNSGSTISVFVITKKRTTGLGNGGQYQGPVAATDGVNQDYNVLDAFAMDYGGSENTPVVERNSGGPNYGTYEPSTAYHDFEYIANASANTLYINGGGAATGGSVGAFAITNITVGGRASGPQYLDGDVAELLVYNTALSTTDRQTDETYLSNKWLSAAYPSIGSAVSAVFTVYGACATTVSSPASSTLPTANTGQSYSQTFTATGGTGPYTWLVTAGSVPGGMTLSSGGVLSGSSPTNGNYSFTVQATDANSCSGTKAYTLAVATCPTITLSPGGGGSNWVLAAGTVQSAYSQTITASGGTGPYTYSLFTGTLPGGLTLSSGGVISGTASNSGTYAFAVLATDTSTGCTGTQSYSLTINCPTLTLTPAAGALTAGTSGIAYSNSFSASGANNSFAYTKTAGVLPTGLSLNSSSGVLSGTPTGSSSNYSFTVTATDSSGCLIAHAYTLQINCPTITVSPTNLPSLVVGTTYSNNITATGSPAPPYKFTNSVGALPTGLTLTSSGLLSGTPTATNTYNFTVTATDTNGCTGSQAYTITTGSAASITAQPTNTTVCSGGNANFNVTGGTGVPLNYAWRKRGNGWGSGNGWTFTAGGGGLFVGSSTIAGANPGINTSGGAWGLFNASIPATTANRTFPAPLAVGQQFQIQLQINNVQAPGGVGFSLLNASSNLVWTFEWIGQGSGYSIVDSSGTNSTTAVYTTGGTKVIFTLTSATTYSATVLNYFSGGTTNTYGPFTGTLLNPTGGSVPDQVSLFNANANNANVNFNLYFNSIVVAGVADDNAAAYSTIGANAGWQISAGNSNGGQAPLSNGGTVSGASTANLTLTGVTTSDSNSLFDVVLTNAFGYVQSSAATLLVNASPAITTATPLPSATINSSYSTTIAASGGTTPYTWSISAGTLPSGLSIASSTGIISGTPTALGTSSFTVTVTDSGATHCPGSSNLTLTVNCPVITVSPPVLGNVSIGAPYNQTVSASGGTGPYTFTNSAGLPAGLTLNSSSGLISGTYNGSAGSASFTVTATDALGCSGQRSYTVQLAACPPITITTPSLPNSTVGSSYSQGLSASGSSATPYTWSISFGSLPAGLTIASSGPTTGMISGTPTVAGVSTFTVSATDTNGCSAPQTYTITNSCPTITFSTADPLTGGAVGTSYSQTITAIGGTSPYTYVQTSGTLPNGLTLSTGGVLSGTPSLSGTYTFAVTATDFYGCASAAKTYHVTINCTATITVNPSTLPGIAVNTAYSTNISASGSTATPYTFTNSVGALPTGLSLSSAGVLSGTPSATNTYNFTITATDTNGCTGSQAYTVVVGGPPGITSQPTSQTVCAGGNATFSVTGAGTPAPNYAWRKRGTGWGTNAWALTAGSGSLFVGSSMGNGGVQPNTTNIDTSGQSWGMINSTASATTTAVRTFPAALQVGQQFQIDMDNGFIDSPNTVGFSLLNASGNIVWEFYIGGNTPYQIHDLNNGSLTTGATYTETGIRVIFTLTSPTTYSATLKNIASGITYGPITNALLNPTGGSVPAKVRLYDAAGNGGSNWQLYFNNIVVAGVADDNAAAYTGATWAGGQTPNLGNSPLSDGGTVTGSATVSLSLTNVATGDSGSTFDVVLTNAYGYAQSAVATLTVLTLPTAAVSGTAVICSNSPTAISAALTGTGPWYLTWNDGFTQSTNSSPASRTVSPITNYTYTVTVVSNTTCTGTSSGSAAITVHGLPTATVSGSTTVCPGNSANIQAALTNGPWNLTWLDGATNYTQNGVASSPAQRTVSPSSTTTYTVTSVSDVNCTGTSSGSAVVTVSASPSVTASSDAPFFGGAYQIVQGQTLHLSATSVAGATAYNWSRSGGGFSAGGQSVSDTPAAGSYTYTVTAPTSCGTAVGSTPTILVLATTDGMIPDSWKTHYGYSASTPSSTVGDNGFTLLQSYLAGLNPTSAASVLDMSSASVTPAGMMTVSWQSEQDGTTPTRLYDFYRVTAPYTNGASWSRIYSNIAPAGATTATNDNAAGVSQRFYRVTIAGHTNDVATVGIAGVQMLTLQTGANYISMSTTQATPTLLSVLGTNLPQGAFETTATTVDIWDQVNQAFLVNNARYWLGTGASGWIQHNTAAPSNNVQLDPTKGFIVTIPANQGPQTLYVPGFVPTVVEAQTVQSNGYTVASSTYPQPITLTGSGLSNSVTGGISLNKSDNLLFFNPTDQLFDIRVWYYTGDQSWHNADASIATQELQPGGAFLIERRNRTTNLIWTNPVPYQVPLQGP